MMMMMIWHWLAVTALMFVTVHGRKEISDKPNIVFILADDLGYNDIGYHAKDHFSAIRTPHLDDLAAKGTTFDNYYVQPVCSPTRGQLLSGRYSIHTGMNAGIIRATEPHGFPLENKLLPEHLRECGYDTHMVGKWHLGFYKEKYLPWNRGFNSFFGFLTGGEDYFTRERCHFHGEPCGVDLWSAKGSKSMPINDTTGEYSAHLFARKAIEAIDKRDASKPLFLYLAYQSVHKPLQVPDRYTEPYAHSIEKTERRTYAGMVSALDESVKNVTDHLDKVGILENTIIVFSTDNGGTSSSGNNWPLRGEKHTLWEGGIRAVGFAYGKEIPEGTVHKGLLDVSDWMPTFLKAGACSAEHSPPLDGVDQWDAIVNGGPTSRTEILHNIETNKGDCTLNGLNVDSPFNTAITAAIRRGPWKLLTGCHRKDGWTLPPEAEETFAGNLPEDPSRGHVKLFNLEDDPNETNDVAEKYPDKVNELLLRLAFHESTKVSARRRYSDRNADPQLRQGFWGPWVEDSE